MSHHDVADFAVDDTEIVVNYYPERTVWSVDFFLVAVICASV